MRALSAACLALSCAVVLAPSLAYADSIGAYAGKSACGLDGDGSNRETDRSERLSIAAVNSGGQASANEESPLIADRVDRDEGEASADHDADNDDATFDERGGLENSAHFANQGSAQVFPDDRTSFSDEINARGFGTELAGAITMALHHGEHDLERELARRGGGALVPQAAASPTPNPEPASVLLIGTGLAGLFRYRRQIFA